jgi:hypothetical protein
MAASETEAFPVAHPPHGQSAHRDSAIDIFAAVLRRPRRIARSAPCVFVLLALVSAAAGAASRPLPAEGGPLRHLVVAPLGIAATAYAGETRLYVSGTTLWRLTPEGVPVQVAQLPGSALEIAASPTVVAVIAQRNTTLWLLAGPPAGPLRTLASCRGPSAALPYSPLAVAGDLVAEALSCPSDGFPPGALATRVHAGDTVRLEPAPSGRRVVTLAGAPGVIAAASQASEDLDGPVRIEVHSTSTGALLYAVAARDFPGVEPTLAVQQDGTIVFCGAHDRLAWASPASPTAHAFADVACPYSYELAISHGVAAYRADRSEALRATVLATGRTRTLLSRASGIAPFAWDGRTALVRGLACDDDFLGAISADAAPYRGPTCDVRIVGVRREHGRRLVAVTLACPTGCRGFMAFSPDSFSKMRDFHLHRGEHTTVRIRLHSLARRMLRRYRSVPYTVTAFYLNPRAGGDKPSIERSGRLAGDGRRRYVPPPPWTGD